MNRIAIYDGYTVPKMDGFAGKKRRKSRRRGGPAKQKQKMKSCARKWRSSGKRGSYRSFMTSCLSK